MFPRIQRPTTVAILAGALAAAACGGDSPAGPTPSPGPRPVASVVIAPVQGAVAAGAVRQLLATPRASDGTALTGREVTWSSSNNEVAEVDATGRLTAHVSGTATITATSEGKAGQLAITVSELD